MMREKTPGTPGRLSDDTHTGHAPIEHPLRFGRARHRRRVIASAAAAMVAVVLGAGVIGANALEGGPGRGDDLVAAPAPDTRLVGIGRVAVAIPAGWADGQASCNSPLRDTAFFPWPQDCTGPDRYVSSVAITSGEFTETGTGLSDLEPAGQVEGHRVVAGEAACSVGQGESCRQVFGIPDLDAYFTVTIPEDEEGGAINRIDAVRDSLTVLSDDQTTVPFVAPGASVTRMRDAIQAAGLAAVVNEQTCPPNASCKSGIVGTTPATGSVLPVGSTVTIDVM